MIRKYAIIIFMVIMSSCEPNNDVNTNTLKLYGDALEDIGYSIAKTDDGYIIGGQFTRVGQSNNQIDIKKSFKKLWIIRTDNDGNKMWKQSYGDSLVDAVGLKVVTLTDGSFIATGYKVDTTKNDTRDVFVVKVSADGTVSTQRTYKEDGNQYGIDILQTSEGFMVLGSTDVARTGTADSIGNASGKRDIYLLRINNNLEPLAAPETFGYPGNDAAVSIKNDAGGGYVIAGTTDYSWPKQSLNNIFILKTNIYGRPNKGIRLLGSADDEYASDMEILDDGYLISGIVGSDGTEQQVYLTKVPNDIFSPIVYAKKYKVTTTASTASSFAVRAMSRYSADQFVLAGQAGTGASAKMLIFVVDANGDQVPGDVMITSATGTQVAYDVIADDSENIIAVGKNSFENNSLLSFLKIRF